MGVNQIFVEAAAQKAKNSNGTIIKLFNNDKVRREKKEHSNSWDKKI